MREINEAALELIKEFEGFRGEAYLDPVGIWTIGYGTTSAAGVGIVPVVGMSITKDKAEWYLQKGIDKFAGEIGPMIKPAINDNQFGAFVSLAYNIGSGGFKRSSALRHFNNGELERAAKSILLWNKGGGKVLSGLVRRRKAEKALFETPPLGFSRPVGATPKRPTGWAAIIAALLALFGGRK